MHENQLSCQGKKNCKQRNDSDRYGMKYFSAKSQSSDLLIFIFEIKCRNILTMNLQITKPT